jgi:hypothetical protein
MVRGTLDSPLFSLGVFLTAVDDDFFLEAGFFFFHFSFFTLVAIEKV